MRWLPCGSKGQALTTKISGLCSNKWMRQAIDEDVPNTMKTKFPISIRIAVLAAVLAFFCQGCFLFTQHSAYRPIHDYARAGDAAQVAGELDKHPGDLNLPDDAGLTPLHLAAIRCRTNVVALLLERGADVNRKSKDGATPLHLAAQEGCTNVVNLLLAKNAKVNAKDNQGRTPFKRAEQWNQDAIVQILRQHGGSE